MTTIMKRFTKGVVLKGESTDVTENAEGSLFQNSAELRLKAYIEGAVRQIVTNTQSQVLTNKTIDADNNSVSNIQTSSLKAGVLNTDTSLTGASNTQLPSALAVKTYVDTKAAAQNEASEISFTPAGTIAATTVQAMGQELDGDIQAHITDTTDAHAASAITNTPSGNLAATTVQGALDELQSDVDTRATTTALTNHTTASANVHGLAVGSSVVGTTDSQVLTNKTITGADIRTPIRSDVKQDTKANLTTYALTATNGQLVFATDTKEMFQVVDATLKAVGGGGGVSDVDSLLIQPFDTSALTDFTQTGLELIETNPLDGTKSARLVHQAASTRSFKQTVAVPPKFRGVNMTASLTIRSSASQGNVTIVFRDETNSVDYPSQQLQTDSQAIASLVTNSTITVSGFSNSNINTLKVGMTVTGSGIPTGTTIASINTTALTITLSQAATASATVSLRFSDLPRTLQLGFNIPANCSSYSYTISALQESGSPETYIDDVVLKNYWLGMSNQGQSTVSLQTANVTAWQQYTPTFQGFGTPSAVEFEWRQVGENVEIRGKWTTGTVTAAEARISLPSGLNSAGTSIIPSIQSVGQFYRNLATTSNGGVVLIEPSVSYMTLGLFTNSNNPITKVTANAAFNSSEQQMLFASVPCAGLTATSTQSFVTTDLVPAKAVFGNSSIDVPNMTAWQGYTPTFQGFGTPSAVEFEWRQVGENVEVRGKFICGPNTPVEARIGLPAGLISANTSIIPSLQIVGHAVVSGASTTYFSSEVLVEPSVGYLNLGIQTSTAHALTKVVGTVYTNGVTLSFFASVPCAGLSALSTKTIALTQSGLVQEADSMVRLDTANGYGSTATRIRRFSNIRDNFGSDITYSDSATNGASFTVNESGIYNISFTDNPNAVNQNIGISKNASSLTSNIDDLSAIERLAWERATSAAEGISCSWSGYLLAGDIIRAHTSGAAASVNERCHFTMSRQGSLSQIAVSSDQKLRIPTSELRFEGSSSRGSTATAIVRFDSIARIRGDAFSVVSDATNGTAITMLKAGKLDVTGSIQISAGNTIYLSKNQITLTAVPLAAESIASQASDNSVSGMVHVAGSLFVNIGDVIRLVSTGTLTSNAQNTMTLSFQEQDIAVSVTNTLPQFSESDSYVRMDGGNGWGSTATRTRRFSNVRDNLGTAVTINDSATDGTIFVIKEAGLYDLSYSDSFSGAVDMAITKNSSNPAGAPSTLALGELLCISSSATASYVETTSTQAYLNVGDLIRCQSSSASAGVSYGPRVSISKVGKPNVTGVNVTPFVNIPQPENEVITFKGTDTSMLSTSTIKFPSSVSTTNKGILRFDNTNADSRFYALKRCTVDVSFQGYTNNQNRQIQVNKNGSIYVGGVSGYSAGSSTYVSAQVQLEVGEYVSLSMGSPAVLTTGDVLLSIIATALSDQILTAPETFSTDTASLQYASSAAYTLATLNTAPVGTYITFTYAANTNTRTQTTTRPTQTDADMNANGLLVYTRAYNAASTSGNPSAIAIQIGKGLKGKSLDLYKSVGKVTAGSTDVLWAGNANIGISNKDYNENTGILVIDCGYNWSATTTTAGFLFSDTTTQNNGYLVINASKNVSLTGFGLNRIAMRATSTAGGAIGTTATLQSFAEETFDTHGAWDGTTFIAPENGYYQVNATIGTATVTLSTTQAALIYIYKNDILYSGSAQRGNGAATGYFIQISDSVYLNKGDTIKIYANSAVATTQNTGAGFNTISISKVSV